MRKRRKEEEHSEGSDYNLPVHKARKTGGNRVLFKPNDRDFRALLDNAYGSKLTAIIKSGLNQYSESNVVKIRNKEDSRKKVTPGTFESLDTEHGSYWTANTAKRLKLNTLDLYMTYVQTHFENLLKELKGTLQSEQLSEDQREVVLLEEQTRAIVVPLHRVLRRDLPPDMRATIMKKFNTALSQYSDFASVGITLKVLSKLHLQPQKERDKRKRIEELMEGADKAEIGDRSDDIITGNKARSVLKKHRKSLKKYRENQR
ncbi:hypothetical protein MFLAVUS_006770 [Mucor flavus]|uniref:Uncharacterized protein n=1 Tax=Mucor flavus TaxID=439312 RepID=A0ABP9Z2G9_9FUNG